MLGAERGPKVENHAASGRDCLEAEVGDRCWGFEIKFATRPADVHEYLEKAVKQIACRRYGAVPRGKERIRAALLFSGIEKRFVAWKLVVEEL